MMHLESSWLIPNFLAIRFGWYRATLKLVLIEVSLDHRIWDLSGKERCCLFHLLLIDTD